MLIKILLISVVIICLGGMAFNVHRVATNNDQKEKLYKGTVGFVVFGFFFLVSGSFSTFYFYFNIAPPLFSTLNI